MINDKKISNEDILINKSWMNYRLRLYELDVLLLDSNEFIEKKNRIKFGSATVCQVWMTLLPFDPLTSQCASNRIYRSNGMHFI